MTRPVSLLLIGLLCLQMLVAQTSRGLSLPAEANDKPLGKTYALIVGISKYQNPAIPPLQFADRDAIAFRNYLVATGVDSNNITLLTNESARYVDVITSLDDLCTEKAKTGDRVFIYFSGHGDVESHVITNEGYLLPYDAPNVVYAISAINIHTLQVYISTLSAKGIQAIVITDACHSGNLAGGLEGLKNMQTVLGDKWKNEIKILSCQPGELSIEGKQWGGGRGLFSYELINGMAGMADKNHDGQVTLRELDLYLMDKIPEEASTLQNPVVNGDLNAKISYVNWDMLKRVSSEKSSNIITAIDIKGLDKTLLINLNDTLKENYRLFNTYLDSLIYVRQDNQPSAYYYYMRMPKTEGTRLLIELMKRNLGAGILTNIENYLHDYVQNEFKINGKIFECELLEANTLRSLMGDSALLRYNCLSKVLFFNAYPREQFDSIQTEISKAKIDSAIEIDSSAAYLFLCRGLILSSVYKNRSYINALDNDKKFFTAAIPDTRKAIELCPMFGKALNRLCDLYRSAGEYDSSLIISRQMLSIGKEWEAAAYFNIANTYGFKARHANNTAASLIDSATFYFKKVMEAPQYRPDRTIGYYYGCIGMFYLWQKKVEEARICFEKRLTIDSSDYSASNAYFGISIYYALRGQVTESVNSLRKCLEKGYRNYDDIFGFEELTETRKSPQFKSLMKKYFPDQYKE